MAPLLVVYMLACLFTFIITRNFVIPLDPLADASFNDGLRPVFSSGASLKEIPVLDGQNFTQFFGRLV